MISIRRMAGKVVLFVWILVFQVLPLGLDAQQCPESGITLNEYASRRRALMLKTDTVAGIVMKSKDASGEYEMMHYRQEQNLLYLTGINEPGILVIMSHKGMNIGGTIRKTVFFAASYSELYKNREKYNTATDTVLNPEEFRKVFHNLAGGISELYISAPGLDFVNDWLNDKSYFIITEVKKKLKQDYPGLKIRDAGPQIASLRQVKSPAELELTRTAVKITGDGILKAMKTCRDGMMEFELRAVIEYEMIRQGAEMPAFKCIIGSGLNSLILHYDKNNCRMRNGEVVVMDVGAQYNGYAADITRTIPVSGKFSREQEEIYNIVLDAQEAVINIIRPGITFAELDKKAKEVISGAGYKNYIIHGVSHPVGLDVHDVISGDTLREGMIITVEPGIYIPADDESLPAAYHGFGIRIEDDVLVKADGFEVLSGNIPKKIDEVEKVMR